MPLKLATKTFVPSTSQNVMKKEVHIVHENCALVFFYHFSKRISDNFSIICIFVKNSKYWVKFLKKNDAGAVLEISIHGCRYIHAQP